MQAIRQFVAAMYLAGAYASGPEWLGRANELLSTFADNDETDPETARLLRVLIAQSRDIYRHANAA